MICVETLAAIEAKLRGPTTKFLPPKTSVKFYSWARLKFFKALLKSSPQHYVPPAKWSRMLWGLEFRSPLLNAAGMFKNGEGYELAAAQGAGAYLAGTTTANKRPGNSRENIYLPFAPYPNSLSASNWLGLPNDGDEIVAQRLAALLRVPGCPVGASLMGSPDLQGQARVEGLVQGLRIYEGKGIDFLELNESCPNTADGPPQAGELKERLEYIAEHFLRKRKAGRKPPVIVKFSSDTEIAQVPELIRLLVEAGFDGVNFGNTSTAYAKHRNEIASSERKLYDYFTSTFGGGVSGAPLRNCTLELTRTAATALRQLSPPQEFHIIRTGGVDSLADVEASLDAGASLVQWYTGFFERFAKDGLAVYEKLFGIS